MDVFVKVHSLHDLQFSRCRSVLEVPNANNLAIIFNSVPNFKLIIWHIHFLTRRTFYLFSFYIID